MTHLTAKLAALLLTVATVGSGTAQACSLVTNVHTTFYGAPDNDPPGPATAYNCGGRNYIAGGTGTYANPLTFATAPGEYNECKRLSSPSPSLPPLKENKLTPRQKAKSSTSPTSASTCAWKTTARSARTTSTPASPTRRSSTSTSGRAARRAAAPRRSPASMR